MYITTGSKLQNILKNVVNSINLHSIDGYIDETAQHTIL